VSTASITSFDANLTGGTIRLTKVKNDWLPSMKYTEYVVKITETVISPDVQFKCAALQRLVLSIEL